MEQGKSACPRLVERDEWFAFLAQDTDPEPDPHQRRRFCRYPVTCGSATLTLAADENAAVVPGRLVNISAGGVMVQVRKWLQVGTPVWIDIELDTIRGALLGRIVHTTQCLGGYKLGIQLVFPERTP